MAAIFLTIPPNPNPKTNSVVFSPRKQLLCRFATNSSFFGSSDFPEKSLSRLAKKTLVKRSETVRVTGLNPTSASHSFDVVVIGAGIIGLTIARQFLLGSGLSVAVVDAAVPCSGATGAGSLLVGRTPSELVMLKRRVQQLSESGLGAEFLSSSDLLLEEPALMLGKEGGAAFLPDDCQLDAHCTVAFIEKINRHFASEGRYAEFYYEPAISLLRSGSTGVVEAVQTSKNTLYGKKAVVIATGCWSGSLMHDLVKDLDIELVVPVKPRKGHLLVIENFNPFKLNHGLMEMGYVDHQTATLQSTISDSGPVHHAQNLSVSMTATMDTSGNLVLGSSRQLVGFNTEIDESIINRIWERAGEFFPALKEISLSDFRKSREVRVGLRPYMPDGKPVIGPVPGLPNVFLAAGHEGEGLSLALGTAEMVADMVLGNPGKVDHTPFALQGR